MSNSTELDRIRNETLDKIQRNQMWFRILVAITGVIELGTFVALVVLMDWADRTHVVIFVASLLVYCTLGMWTWALAARNRVGEQRIIQAVELLGQAIEALENRH